MAKRGYADDQNHHTPTFNTAENTRTFKGTDKVRVHKLMKLARLAPHYVEAIAKGKGPIGLSVQFFVRKTLPYHWGEQEELLDSLSK